MTISVEIIATGSELLHDGLRNTTTPFLISQLTELGYEIKKISTVDDRIEEIKGAVQEALRRADLTFVTGGLGPTPDDLTREAVAEALSIPLEFRSDLWEEIQQYFNERHATITSVNIKQAYLPCGAHALHNPLGTAPGFLILNDDDRLLVVLPGPPGEAREMFSHEVRPFLEKHYPAPVSCRCAFNICGCGETVVYDRIQNVIKEAQAAGIKYSFIPGPGELKLILNVNDPNVEKKELFRELSQQIKELSGSDLYGVNEESLTGKVGELLTEKGATIGVAESCTGGLVTSYLTDVPGSSHYISGGIIAYSCEIKESILGVNSKTLGEYGAVSAQTAKEMASGVRRLMNAAYGLATTGFAGPDGGTEENPVGTVYLGLATAEKELAQRVYFPGIGRTTLKKIAAKRAIDFLRRYLIDPDGVDQC
ncbi:MAG: competence/damage-inducible protein A [Syntrophaceticus sp.]|nr:competence/damage-inducible protein A [Syntrophaceticus sp.]MDD3313934.1 competence/damage-inducible protein A [Syntrophaceticus sp.]MDD4359012.1 competence/damage-inducible protein A [Syntrophaceticus sp.]MDD4782239.1 competence/damage-inducible protein A [Syntrophaceticus sp.]